MASLSKALKIKRLFHFNIFVSICEFRFSFLNNFIYAESEFTDQIEKICLSKGSTIYRKYF